MHLGNARTALLAWLDARSRGGRILLRIEDLDRDRCRPQYADLARRDLAWLGLDWDAETALQSTRERGYAAAVARLAGAGVAYPCSCSRRELAVASAPHGEDGERRYPGTCRDPARRPAGRPAAVRVMMPDHELTIDDRLHGPVVQNPARQVGDVVVRRSDGLHAYQLAVVVDDAADGVTDVVRGDDLLASAGRQRALQQLLGLPAIGYAHVPLMRGVDGARLAKRHGAITIAEQRAAGRSPAVVVGELAAGLGLVAPGQPATPLELVAGFRLASAA